MPKISRPEAKFDEELLAQGKRRILVPETTEASDGRLCLAYREKIVDIEDQKSKTATKPWWKLAKSKK